MARERFESTASDKPNKRRGPKLVSTINDQIVESDPVLESTEPNFSLVEALELEVEITEQTKVPILIPTHDPLEQYFAEIRKFRMLVGEEEVHHSQRVILGQSTIQEIKEDGISLGYPAQILKELGKIEPKQSGGLKFVKSVLDKYCRELPEIGWEQHQHINQAKESLDDMIEGNLRLVVSIAKKYAHRGLPLMDLIQEGNLGLSRAAELYDWSKGFRFSTYATWWIKQGVLRGITEQSRTIRYPVYFSEIINKATGMINRHRNLGNSDLTDQDVAQILKDGGMSNVQIDQFLEHLTGKLTPKSLDDIIQQEMDNRSLSQRLVAPNSDTAEAVVAEIAAADIRDIFEKSRLTDRERAVLQLRFGLGGNRSRTLEEVGQQLGLSRERIRQLEKVGLLKLRANFGKELRDLLR